MVLVIDRNIPRKSKSDCGDAEIAEKLPPRPFQGVIIRDLTSFSDNRENAGIFGAAIRVADAPTELRGGGVVSEDERNPEPSQGARTHTEPENEYPERLYSGMASIAVDATKPSNDGRNNPKGNSKHWLEYLTALFAVIAAVASSFAAGFAGYQGWVARDTERRQLRAYVLPSESNIVVSAPNNLQIHFVVKNFGLTPAYKLRGWTCVIVGRFEKDVDGNIRLENSFPVPPFDEKAAPPTTVAPQDTKNSIFPSFCDGAISRVRPVTSDEVARIQSGKAAVYLYGEQYYFDAFGAPHFTKYRIVGPGSGVTFDAQEGNDSD